MSIEWIDHKGKKIFYQDYRHLSVPEMIAQAEKGVKMAEKAPDPLLILIDIRETFLNKDFMEKVKQIALSQKSRQTKSAILGINGIKKILLNSFNILTNQNSQAFGDETAAKDYLVL